MEDSKFTTSDTPLATYLIQTGFPLIDIEYFTKQNSKRQAVFLFKNTPKLREHVNLFERGEATINLMLYEHTKSSLLDRIMRGK